ncbi:MAG: DUF3127 domain-containing protein [Muribaculaceae bacterium]|nr:DUF3127 domain-containing protein [Muribaculaceae bacterium]
MEIIGKITHAFPEVSGVSKAGKNWRKREYVLETQESYPQKIFFDFFGDKADQFPLEVGQTVRLSFDISSREYNGRWFTSISAWRAEQVDPQTVPQQPTEQPYPASSNPYNAPTIPPVELAPSEPTDDLPF